MPSPKIDFMTSCTHPLKFTRNVLCAGPLRGTRAPDNMGNSHTLPQGAYILIEEADNKQIVR